MSISLLAAVVSALAAVVFTGMLALRCARAPQIGLIPWPIAALGLTVALMAQAYGYKQGFGPASFRAIQLGAQLAAPLALIWALAEGNGRSAGARFAARLGLAALAVVGGVILAIDPLGSVTFSQAWPPPSVYYQFIPHYVLTLITAVVVVWAVVAAAVAGARSRRDERGRRMFPAALAGAAAALLTQALRVALPANSAYVAVCLAAVALTWFAGRKATEAPAGERYDEDWDSTGAYGGYGRYPEDDTGYDRLYRDDTGGFGVDGDDTGYGFYRPDTGAFAVDTGGFGPDTGYSLYRADSGMFAAVGDDTGGFDRFYRDADRGPEPSPSANGDGIPALIETGAIMGVDGILPGAPPDADPSRLYGQITIYTLHEDQAEEFDRLAKAVVEQVKAHEPTTLVYVMHGVPSAPMQRILYEVYQDADAFTEHEQQSYVRQFGEDRRAYVLATNVIELGVRQAKVMPLPGTAPRGRRVPDPGSSNGRAGPPGRRRARSSPGEPGGDYPTPPQGGFGGRRRGRR